jgi:hypothetical protein
MSRIQARRNSNKPACTRRQHLYVLNRSNLLKHAIISVFLYFCSGFFPFLLRLPAPAIPDCGKSTQCFWNVSELHQETHAVPGATCCI